MIKKSGVKLAAFFSHREAEACGLGTIIGKKM
jgi:hypothetical protein